MASQPVGNSPSDATAQAAGVAHDDPKSAAADAAFEQLLLARGGPWHPTAPLAIFTQAYVLMLVRQQLPTEWSVEQIDMDGVVTEALLALRRSLPLPQKPDGDGYRAMIRGLVDEEIDHARAPSQPLPVVGAAPGTTALPPSLRATADLIRANSHPDEICDLLGISRIQLESRIERIKQYPVQSHRA